LLAARLIAVRTVNAVARAYDAGNFLREVLSVHKQLVFELPAGPG